MRVPPFAASSPPCGCLAYHSFPGPASADVGLVVGLEDTALLDDYFSRFMRPDPQGGYPGSLVKNVSPPEWTQVGSQDVAK